MDPQAIYMPVFPAIGETGGNDSEAGVELLGALDPVEGISIMVFDGAASTSVYLDADQREALGVALLGATDD